MKKERVEKERDHLLAQKKRRQRRERIKVIKKNTIVLQCHNTFRMAL